MARAELRGVVERLDKVELHLHLEGSISAAVAAELAALHGVALPAEPGRFANFGAFIEAYLSRSRLLADAQSVALAAGALGATLAGQRVSYAEVTFTPMTHIVRGVAREALVEGLVQGRADAGGHGVELRWVFDIVRSFPGQADATLAFARLVERRDAGSVVGLGLGGPEDESPPAEAIIRSFARARADGLRSLPHAGEQAGPASIWAAIRQLGADRIGHGVRCLEDPELVAYLRDNAVPLEVCPTSNVVLGVVPSLAEHPLPALLEAGLTISIATDDPGLFRTDLVTEYVRCAEAFGWDESQVRALIRDAADQSFRPRARHGSR